MRGLFFLFFLCQFASLSNQSCILKLWRLKLTGSNKAGGNNIFVWTIFSSRLINSCCSTANVWAPLRKKHRDWTTVSAQPVAFMGTTGTVRASCLLAASDMLVGENSGTLLDFLLHLNGNTSSPWNASGWEIFFFKIKASFPKFINLKLCFANEVKLK